jgi:hypothetical protein
MKLRPTNKLKNKQRETIEGNATNTIGGKKFSIKILKLIYL